MSPFNWKTGEPSCMYTIAGHRTAQKLAKAGMARDTAGRALVDMAPRSKQSISINPNSKKSGDRNDSIKRGGI